MAASLLVAHAWLGILLLAGTVILCQFARRLRRCGFRLCLVLILAAAGIGCEAQSPHQEPEHPQNAVVTPEAGNHPPVRSSGSAEASSANKKDNSQPAAAKSKSKNINEILPRTRQDLIIDLAERLERKPEVNAYLLPGDSLEPDGSRQILMVSNPAMRTLYDSPPAGVTLMELAGDPQNGPGARALNQALLERGFQAGYQANSIYMLNFEVGIFGRDEIIGLADSIKSGR